jgi:hypothetical protein
MNNSCILKTKRCHTHKNNEDYNLFNQNENKASLVSNLYCEAKQTRTKT